MARWHFAGSKFPPGFLLPPRAPAHPSWPDDAPGLDDRAMASLRRQFATVRDLLSHAPSRCDLVACYIRAGGRGSHALEGDVPNEIRPYVKELIERVGLAAQASMELPRQAGRDRVTIGLAPLGWLTLVVLKKDRPRSGEEGASYGIDGYFLHSVRGIFSCVMMNDRQRVMPARSLPARRIPSLVEAPRPGSREDKVVEPTHAADVSSGRSHDVADGPGVTGVPIAPTRDPWLADSQREEAAFRALLPELLRERKGQFVAVLGGKVVDGDADEFILAKRVYRKYQKTKPRFVLIRQVREGNEELLHFDSPEALEP